MYKVKQNPAASVKDVSIKSRTVTGYFATFNVVDSDKDKIIPGAFKKTVEERGPEGSKRIKHLWMHRWYELVGALKVLKEDEIGLYFESAIPDTTLGTDVLKMYKAEMLNEHSIGFELLKGDPQDEFYIIKEVRLWEGSTVTWGANEFTPFQGFKSKGQKPQVSKEDAVAKVNHISKFLKTGDVSDEMFEQLEIGLAQLKSYISSLESEPDKTTHSTSEPDNTLKDQEEAAELVKSFTKIFN